MIAGRRRRVVGWPLPPARAWARGSRAQEKKKVYHEGATRIELATAGSAILCSTAELHTLARIAGRRIFLFFPPSKKIQV